MTMVLLMLSVAWVGNGVLLWIGWRAVQNKECKSPVRLLTTLAIGQLCWTALLVNALLWQHDEASRIFLLILLGTATYNIVVPPKHK